MHAWLAELKQNKRRGGHSVSASEVQTNFRANDCRWFACDRLHASTRRPWLVPWSPRNRSESPRSTRAGLAQVSSSNVNLSDTPEFRSDIERSA